MIAPQEHQWDVEREEQILYQSSMHIALDEFWINELAHGNNVGDTCFVVQANAEFRGSKFAEQVMQGGCDAKMIMRSTEPELKDNARRKGALAYQTNNATDCNRRRVLKIFPVQHREQVIFSPTHYFHARLKITYMLPTMPEKHCMVLQVPKSFY
jgi:hypothetical protein